MENDPYASLAAVLTAGREGNGGLVLGSVVSWPSREAPERPHKIIAEGNTQEREDLLADPGLLPYGLSAGDRVVLLPVEERQRYVIICKVVSL